MSRLKNWSFKDLSKFLEAYGFELGHIEGSHHYFNGRIKGEDRSVQAILSKKERKAQSDKTMNMAIEHSAIPRKYFEEWKETGFVHEKIIG